MNRIGVILFFMASFLLADALTMTVPVEPGRLSISLTSIKKSKPDELILTGTADVRDFALFHEFPASVRKIDMSSLSIKGYVYMRGSWSGETNFQDNELPMYSFFDTQVEEVVLPYNLESIGDGAFASSSIKKITLPAGLRKIGAYSFYGSTKLRAVDFPDALSSIGNAAFARCEALDSIDISSTSVSILPASFVEGCRSLAKAKLPSRIGVVEKKAFAGSGIKRISLPNVLQIGDYSMANMPSLEEVALNSGARIGKGALFCNASLDSVAGAGGDIPELAFAASPRMKAGVGIYNVERFGEYSLAGNQSETLILGSKVSEICSNAFEGMTNLKRVDVTPLDLNIPHAEDDAFGSLDLSRIDLLVGVDNVDEWKRDSFWSRFNIRGVLSGIDEISDAGDIKIYSEGGKIIVSSDKDINFVEIYDMSGIRLYADSEVSLRKEISGVLSAGQPVIVRVESGTSVKVARIAGH